MDDPRQLEIASFLAECWEETVKKYPPNDTRTGKPLRDPWLIRIDGKHNENITAHQLVEEAQNAAFKFTESRGQLAGKILFISDQINRHARAIDVLIQLQPSVAPAIWGPMRIILQVIDDKERASEVAIDGINHVACHLRSWEDLASIFSQKQQVREAVIQLYGPAFEFLVSAKQHFTQSSFKRFWRSLVVSQKDKLAKKLSKLEDAASSLDRVVRVIDTREQAAHRAKVETKLATLHEDVLLRNATIERLDRLARQHLDVLQRGFSVTQEGLSSKITNELQMAISQCVKNSQQEVLNHNQAREWLAIGRRSLSVGDALHPIEGTGQWLFTCKQWTSWSNDGGILWIDGKPGSGKSHLSRVINERLKFDYQKAVIQCSFHGGLSGPRSSNPSSFAASVLHHILEYPNSEECVAAVLSPLNELRKNYPAGPGECPWESLWRLCRRALEAQPQPRYFLVIDALDECCFYNGGPEPLKLKTILRELKGLSRSSVFQTIILSRPHSDFFDLTEADLRISIDQGLNADDIQLFVSEKFKDYDIPSPFKDTVLETTRKRAEGTFLWAHQCLEYADNLPCEDDIFLERLQSFPTGLSPVYDRMTRESASRLDKDNRAIRRALFILMYEAQEPLSLDDISRILRLGKFNPLKTVLKVGRPLIEVKNNEVTFMHTSIRDWLSDESRLPIGDPDQTLFIRSVDSHMRLAKECLLCLLDAQYGSERRIGQLIHHNFDATDTKFSAQEPAAPAYKISFDYAYQYWDFHLTEISDPEPDVMDLTQKFLHQPHFAYWAEYTIYNLKSDKSKIRNTNGHLQKWYSQLSDEKKSLVTVDDYFSYPYTRLSEAYRETQDEDQLLQWLTLLRLARYFWDLGTAEKAVPLLNRVVDGLQELLGSQAPLTLNARREKALMYLEQDKPQEANSEFVEIVRIQKERLGPDDPELYYTLHCRGEPELLLNRYKDCLLTQKEAAWGFLRLSHPDDSRYLSTQVWIGLSCIELGDLNQALTVLDMVFENRRERYGKEDLFAAAVQLSIGNIQRKQRKAHESLRNLRQSLAVKSRILPLSNIWTMDVAISLLIAFRDFALIPEALSMLADLDRDGHVDKIFDRFCQTTHLRGLVLSDQGQKNDAISLLQNLLIQTDREKYNRALMWIILDLAIMLRTRGKDGDKKQAEVNFNNIVVDQNHEQRRGNGDDPEPDPPRLLQLAEKALTLTRNRKFEEVENLFKAEQITWYRSKDIWLAFGAPPADTAWMRGPFEAPWKI